MFDFSRGARSFIPRLDALLIIATFLLVIFGLLIIWSTNPDLSARQLRFALFGFMLFFSVLLADYRFVEKIAPLVLLASLVLLVLTFLLGHYVRGANRWLSLGSFSFQPSEFSKLGLILGLAWFFSIPRVSIGLKFLISLLVTLLFVGLVAVQPDLGTAGILIFIWMGISFMAEVPLKYLLFLLFLGIMSLPVGWHFLAPYQQRRIYAFLNPTADPLGSGYNVLQAIIAIGSGGAFGKGLGRGTQSQLRFLPERSTDFIFASMAEEWGLLGVVMLLTLFLVLLVRTFIAASRSGETFGSLLCMGVFFMLLSQIFINVGMNLGVMPITGLPLPLISAGGSSLVVTLLSLGLIGSVALHRET